MRGDPSISPIYKRGPSGRQDENVMVRLWRIHRDLWRKCGVIACRPRDLPEHLRGPMEEWASDIYGGRDGKR